MRYFISTVSEPVWQCSAFAVEVDDQGWVKREVGLSPEGRVIHRSPSELHRYGSQGLWTGFLDWEVAQALQDPGVRPITREQFEAWWSEPAPPPPDHRRRRGWRRALDNLGR